ncbi:MAG: tRNA (adenosine(37)-N6)-threonylcarbamoyltransferase complex transferase subunit TsaD [Rhodospirillaceae bacterium]|jgi:N6-L-threonylcarbamoyladenine synthase|nr:tRNA (adenosine(37)-N6)-threonylcarbamoyltransferase complex transferase subunit TsaD [Rhodospirillaceae bacterium]MBT5665583.1 tRNA (adenosine(37)-N6)-threonylcarbamoyltransferase complex transferase subunit TsaD [Rhodospirillaceae bacterium]
MIVLGIESSCDETAAAVVGDNGVRGGGAVLSNVVYSQLEEHRPYGGVVPEIAARSHLSHIDGVVEQAMTDSGLGFGDLDGVAATGGPGLIGGVLVGMMTAKAIALVHDAPLIAVNHLEGHALTARLTDDVSFPYLLLLVSGGHCQLLDVAGPGQYTLYGTTIDDAVGEAFDKTAKLLGLPYPGGPAVEAAAQDGDPDRFRLPRPMTGRPGCDFSFSGLKTAVARLAERTLTAPADERPANERDVSDIAASFQAAVAGSLVDRTRNAIRRHGETHGLESRTLVIAGGVASNQYLRNALTALTDEEGLRFVAPPPALCTDNAAMIAWAGVERLRLGLTDDLDFAPRPRWPLDATLKQGAA